MTTITGGCLAVLTLVIALLLFSAWVFQFAWNLAIPSLFNGPTIEFGPALGAVLLLSIVASLFNSRSTQS